ncbi:MAG: SIMPL domain-containing protein [Ferruginibacter sp.]
MKNFILSSFFMICAVSFASAQIGGNATYNGNNNQQGYYGSNSNANSVNLNLDTYSSQSFANFLEANVMVNVKASSFVAIFSLSQHGKTIEEADQMMNERIELFRKLVSNDETRPDQFFTDPVSLVPVYETQVVNKKYSRTYNEVPDGFEMKKNIHLTFRNHESINQIISYAAKAEIYDLVKADYIIDDLDKVLAKLREEAMTILTAKKVLIEKAGISIKFSQVGEKYGSAHPFERYQQYYAYKTAMPKYYGVSYSTNRNQQVVYNTAEKNKTIYYEKVSEKQFDKVINPVVGEPMVQVYLSLKGQYQSYDPAKEAADNAYNERMRAYTEKEVMLRLLEKEKQIEQMGKKSSK